MVGAFTNAFSRVWFQSGGAGPSRIRRYFGNWKAGALAWGQGDLTVIREPDPAQYNKFLRAGRFRGEPGDPELTITSRYSFARSELLKAARSGCEHTLHIHMGECKDPQDFARGWDKMIIMEGAAITNYATQDLGAMTPGENAAINEDTPFRGTDLYEVVRINFARTGGAIPQGLTSIYVCDAQQCGACGVASDGCQVVLALQGVVATGAAPVLRYTSDGGATWGNSPITTLTDAQRADALLCVGPNVVVLSEADEAAHYANLSDVLRGVGVWTRVASGYVATHGPVASYSLGATETYGVGAGGFVYHTDDPTQGVRVVHGGSATTQDLTDVHAFDALNIVAVGAGGTVLASRDGGNTWGTVAQPANVVLNAVWAHSPLEWFVGTATGRLFYTLDGGATWTEKAFPGSGVGAVRDIKFVTPSVGYMAHNTAAPAGRVLRTLDGGYSWYVLPEGTGSIPANDYVASLATCADPNIIFGAGLDDNGTLGFIVKAA